MQRREVTGDACTSVTELMEAARSAEMLFLKARLTFIFI
jgi:hypothetical protein